MLGGASTHSSVTHSSVTRPRSAVVRLKAVRPEYWAATACVSALLILTALRAGTTWPGAVPTSPGADAPNATVQQRAQPSVTTASSAVVLAGEPAGPTPTSRQTIGTAKPAHVPAARPAAGTVHHASVGTHASAPAAAIPMSTSVSAPAPHAACAGTDATQGKAVQHGLCRTHDGTHRTPHATPSGSSLHR